MKDYVVTYENGGTMKTRKFASYFTAKKFAMKMLSENNYPAVKLTSCEGMKVLNIETFCK